MSSAAEYWVGPTIGEGAFGHVVYAIHKATERKVAIKVMEVPTTTTSHHAREEHRRHLRHHEEHQLKQKTAMILNKRRILSLPGLKFQLPQCRGKVKASESRGRGRLGANKHLLAPTTTFNTFPIW